jgi:predicted O-methyltransferase YrrM
MSKKTKMQDLWIEIDRYFVDRLLPKDKILDAALKANRKAGLPAIDVSPLQGSFLAMLVRISGARRVLEIGTLGAYSTIWIARALPEGGMIVTLEADPAHAKVARKNLHNAGVEDRVELREGKALETLPKLKAERAGPFDLIFIDADKPSNPQYLEWALKLSRPGTTIVVDNITRHGKVIEADSKEADIQGTRRCIEMMGAMLGADPRLSATAIQTVGSKGHDGFAIAVVLK